MLQLYQSLYSFYLLVFATILIDLVDLHHDDLDLHLEMVIGLIPSLAPFESRLALWPESLVIQETILETHCRLHRFAGQELLADLEERSAWILLDAEFKGATVLLVVDDQDSRHLS